MEEYLKEAIKQVPALVVMLVLVRILVVSFMKQLTESRTAYVEAIENCHSENIEARKLDRETIKENSNSVTQQTMALRELTQEVKELRAGLGTALKQFTH